MKRSVLLAIIALALTACEKEIIIDLNSTDPQIVIEGAIHNEPGPYFVKISKTINFSDSNNYPTVSDALVIIEDSRGTSDTLTETSAGLYQTNYLAGQPGLTYYLKIDLEGEQYSAIATMPEVVRLDSLRFNVFSSPGADDRFIAIPVFTDPPTPGNNYRFLQTVNGQLDPSYIVFNDNINNGLTNQRPIFSADAEIYLGDTVHMEMRSIDHSTYNYFYTLSQIDGGGPGGGTTPSNPPNNLNGPNAIGLFSAYTRQHRTQIVK